MGNGEQVASSMMIGGAGGKYSPAKGGLGVSAVGAG